MREDIRQQLIKAAKAEEVVFYLELGVGRGKKLGQILGDISEYEHGEGHPLLSAIAVSKVKGMPNEGFWGLPSIPPDLTDKQRPVYWARECIRVIDYWQRQPRGG
jgi:hypothetical protein